MIDRSHKTAGNYQFSCGMGMFHGSIEVEE